ncbi:MAG: ATP-binding protein involved in chromosome partitioning [Candidatus Binatota bacterium]|jgi:ATP-binding protein involved in chromosome partitioning|nr:ATP-binding protein involved in chromosome partitioning [Candidatus Binatota bacterium]
MSTVDLADVRRRLEQVAFPGFHHSIVRYGLVGDVRVAGGDVTVALLPASRRPEVREELRRRVTDAVRGISGVTAVNVVEPEEAKPAGGPPSQGEPIVGVRRILAVSSCKGGVGKSTVAVNLALALKERGAKVGLLDADIYGPSVPMMMGVDARPRMASGKVEPIDRYGVSLMSMGFFLDDKSPVIWRGPMVMGAIRQFLRDVEWGELDDLIVDMPPGTGDAALTLAQQVPLSGAVIVTTPQEVALQDVERGIAMFRQVSVPVLGVVENMAYYVCPECGEREDVFGSGGGDELSRLFRVPVLAQLPLVPEVRQGGDDGRPIVVSNPDHPVSQAFRELARAIDQARPGGA